MSLTLIPAHSWPEVSRLFDEAMELDSVSRESWLAQLAVEQPALALGVQALLWADSRRETDDFLERGPQWAGAAQVDDEGVLHPGDSVGPYRLLSPLGSGGMAEVWLAERGDGTLDRNVALKLPQQFKWRPGVAARFSRERDILARLEHPYIARLYDAGLSEPTGPGGGRPYLALEYVRGTTLTSYCDERRLGTSERLALAQQVLDAVQYAHTRLVIHRDLKPANILVTENGQVRLLDFGVAKLLQGEDEADRTQLTQVAGPAFTPNYASPEQVRGEALGTASDVYSLGVVFYELLCGHRPYQLRYDSAAQLEQAIVEAEPEPPSNRVDNGTALARGTTAAKLRRELRGELDTILLRALKKQPDERYGTAAAFAEDFRRHRVGEPVSARPDSWRYRSWKYIIRNRLIVSSAATVVLALTAGLIVSIWQTRLARQEAAVAQAIKAFMVGIFSANSNDAVDPLKARNTTARELLDIAAKSLSGTTTMDPLAKLAVMDQLQEIYQQLHLLPESIRLGEDRLKLAHSVFGRIRKEDIAPTLQLANTKDVAGDDGSEQLLQQATEALDQIGDNTSAMRAYSDYINANHYLNVDNRKALVFAEHSIQIARNPEDSGNLLIPLGQRLTLLGAIHMGLNNWQQADRALDEAADVGNDAAGDAPYLYQVRGRVKQQLGLFKAAEASFRHSVELARKIGANDSAPVARALDGLGTFLVDTNQYSAAEAILAESYSTQKQQPGADTSPFTSVFRMHYARALAGLGRLEDARALVEESVAAFRIMEGYQSFVGQALLTEVPILLEMGDIAAAKLNLRLAREVPGGVSGYGVYLADKHDISVVLDEGLPSKALMLLDKLDGPGRNSMEHFDLRLLRVKALMVLKDYSGADEVVNSVLKDIAADSLKQGYFKLEAGEANLLKGLLSELAGNTDLAISGLNDANAAFASIVDPNWSTAVMRIQAALARNLGRASRVSEAKLANYRSSEIAARHPALRM